MLINPDKSLSCSLCTWAVEQKVLPYRAMKYIENTPWINKEGGFLNLKNRKQKIMKHLEGKNEDAHNIALGVLARMIEGRRVARELMMIGSRTS